MQAMPFLQSAYSLRGTDQYDENIQYPDCSLSHNLKYDYAIFVANHYHRQIAKYSSIQKNNPTKINKKIVCNKGELSLQKTSSFEVKLLSEKLTTCRKISLKCQKT